jgi:hypothetical protein
LGKDFGIVGGLSLPRRLITLIDAGFWPGFVSKERVHLFAPEEDEVYLFKPPFCTVAQRVSSDTVDFWSEFGALEQITPELCIDIADFGLGSDSPIVLNYRESLENPSVLRLHWRKPQPNVWVRCADTFDSFADMLDLEHSSR